jgi:hypothetical protein
VDWQCSGCNRHYSFMVNECPHCQPAITITSSGTHPTVASTGSLKFEQLYNELLLAVEQKCEGESRHQTALRLIRSSQSNSECGSKLQADA